MHLKKKTHAHTKYKKLVRYYERCFRKKVVIVKILLKDVYVCFPSPITIPLYFVFLYPTTGS